MSDSSGSREEMAHRLVRAACQVLEQKLGSRDVSMGFIAESYSLVSKFLARLGICDSVLERDEIDKTLVDELALGLYMTAVVQEEAKNNVAPDVIQSFRGAVLDLLTDSPTRDS
jgi:hypothetical protein